MMKRLILFFLFVSQLSAQETHVRWSAVASYTASEFDASTTYVSLQNCSCYEANPIIRPIASNPSIFFVYGAQAWVFNKASISLDNHGHSRWARVLQWGSIAAHSVAGIHNLGDIHHEAILSSWRASLVW